MLIYYAEQFKYAGGLLHSTLEVASRAPTTMIFQNQRVSIKGI